MSSTSLSHTRSRPSLHRLLFEAEQCNGPLSLGPGKRDRSIVFRVCQLGVLIFRLLTPLSYLYLLLMTISTFCWHPTCTWIQAWFCLPKIGDSIHSLTYLEFGRLLLFVWMVCEALFFPYYYICYRHLSDPNDDLPHFATKTNERIALAEKCFEAVSCAASKNDSNPFEYPRKVIEGWFLDTPLIELKRGNLLSWTAWAFFDEEISNLSPEEQKENNLIANLIEKKAGWTFPEGFSASVPAARLTLDPLFVTQRPFCFYATIFLINTFALTVLKALGYSKLRGFVDDDKSQNFYFRPAKPSVSSSGEKKLPIVFVHGIGVGFAAYLSILVGFPSDVDVFLIEWPYVSMQMVSAAPKVESTVNAVCRMLQAHGHTRACFVAHSLGTTLLAWMLHSEEGSRMVGSSLLLDPVIFLLCDPTVATMFVYKDPSNALDLLMHFFLSRELYIANALSRHFSWSHNIMFVEDYDNCDLPVGDNVGRVSPEKRDHKKKPVKHTIILSSRDVIVPVERVGRYLDHKLNVEKLGGFEVLVFGGGTHGEAVVNLRWIGIIGEKIRKRILISSDTN